MCGRSTQYVMKWLASVRMAEGVLKRRKERRKRDNAVEARRGGRGKAKKSRVGEGVVQCRKVVQKNTFRAYSDRHQIWAEKQLVGARGLLQWILLH